MKYAAIALIVFAVLTTAEILSHTRAADDPRIHRLITIADAAFGVAGAVMIAAAYIFIRIRISSVSGDAASGGSSFASWASDMLDGWYSVAVPVVGILLGINVIAAVFSQFDKKQQKKVSVFLRAAVLTVSSAVPMLLAPFYGFMTANDTVPLYTAILVSGIGMALVFRAVSLIERL